MKTTEEILRENIDFDKLQALMSFAKAYSDEQCKAYKELSPVSFKLIGEIIDNYEADAINLPAEMYNDLKFHWKRLKQLINDK